MTAGVTGGLRKVQHGPRAPFGVLFVIANFALSRFSRRLELRERRLTGTTLQRVRGVEDQVAADPV